MKGVLEEDGEREISGFVSQLLLDRGEVGYIALSH